MKRTWIFLLMSSALAWPAEFPIKEITLYKHGVGFFERGGRLAAGESARLDFNASEMNDILKSLTVEERGGGRITGLRYDSIDPLSRKLAEFPFQIGPANALSAVLDQLKGARVELQFGNETLAGTILGARAIAGGEKNAEREQINLLLDSGEMRMLDLSAATGIRLTDSQLQAQFRDYLAALALSRSKDKRSVYIDSTDVKERDLKVDYMTPTPVWKSSYRMIFGGNGRPVLEGWAIIDNTSGEDWNKVQLSLVSGRPISFVSQLYAPRYVNRPGAELPDDRAAAPVLHEPEYDRREALLKAAARPQATAFAQNVAVADTFSAAAPSTVAADAATRELGDLFEYRIATPVTIRKNESAMLPFLQQPVDTRKLLIYSPQRGSEHPTDAAEITNNTGKTLDGGPITVYDEGAYAGEALMETLKSGDKRLISYAVDLGTRITDAFGSKQAVVREIHANRGILTTRLAAEETRTYTIKNIDQKAKTLILEHSLRPGYTLLNQKPAEKTAGAYRFEIRLAPGTTEEFPVREERVYDQSTSVSSLTPDALLVYVRNRDLNDTARDQLQRIADQKSQVADTQRALQDAENQIKEVNADEDRVRRNIQSLNSVSGQQQQVQNYARQLDAHEQQLAGLRDRQADLQKKKSALEADLARLIDALAF